MGDYDVAAQILANGVKPVDYLGAFNRGANLAQNTTNVYDSMQAKRQMINAQESGNPQELGAAQRMAQVRDPAYANNIYAAQNNQAVALGNRQEFNVADRSMVAQMALSARTPQEKYQILQQEADEHDANGFDSAPIRQTMDMLAQGQDITPVLQTLAQQGQKSVDPTADMQNYDRMLVDKGFADYQNRKNAEDLRFKNAPSGYMFNEDRTAIVPIPGFQQTPKDNPLIKGAPSGKMWVDPNDPTKGLLPIEGAPKGAEAVPTEGERKAGTLLQRLSFSQKQLEAALVTDPDSAKPGIFSSGLRAVGMEVLANSTLVPEKRQQVENAQLDILDAALTLGTGAAYTREQLEGYRKSYFPQIGDKPATIKDKQDRLNNVIDAAKIAAGRVYKGDQLPEEQKQNTQTSQQPAPTPMQVKVGNHSFTVKP